MLFDVNNKNRFFSAARFGIKANDVGLSNIFYEIGATRTFV